MTSKRPAVRMPEPDVEVPSPVDSIQVLESVIQKVHAHNIKRYQDIIQRSLDANDGLEPTVDRMGRWHSPRDGYINPETDRVYPGGAYLPFPEEYHMEDGEMRFRGGKYSSVKGWRYQDRVKMDVQSAEALVALIASLTTKANGIYAGYFDCTTGQQWMKDGQTLCYAYIKAAYKPIFDATIAFAKRSEYVQSGPDPKTFPVWPEARITITGNILSKKQVPTPYGDAFATRVLIQALDGNKAYGTLPASMLALEEGDAIALTATVTMNEPGFYYYRNPRSPS